MQYLLPSSLSTKFFISLFFNLCLLGFSFTVSFLTDLAAYFFAPVVTSTLRVFLLTCLCFFFPIGPNSAFSLMSDVFFIYSLI